MFPRIVLITTVVIARAMAFNFTYLPGYFAQDFPTANATELGAVRRYRFKWDGAVTLFVSCQIGLV